MQQYTVPQFIDVESKIIGPITTRQFLIFLGTGVIGFIFYKIFDFALFLTATVILAITASVFAFVKINGRPFHFFVLNLVQTFRKPGLRVWNHRAVTFEEKEAKQVKFADAVVNKELNKKTLEELSLIVDTKGKYQGEEDKS